MIAHNKKLMTLNFERKAFIVPFCMGIVIAVYAFARLGHGPFPFAIERIQKILAAFAIALVSWFFGSRRRTANLKFERKPFIIPFCMGITIALYALIRLGHDSFLFVSMLMAAGAAIAAMSWIWGSRGRVQRAQSRMERWIEAVAFKTAPQACAANDLPQESRDKQKSRIDDYFVVLMAVIVTGCAVFWAFLAPLPIGIDDLGLFNPVYMYLHTGKMSYPAYGMFHAMVVHPPTHYLILAWVMKAGVPLQYATAVVPFLLILLTTVLLVRSRFAPEIKIGLLFGFIAGAMFFYWYEGPTTFALRPDLHLAYAWFAGLVALECGRLQSWDPLQLGLGAFLLTYASGLHYPASLAWTGVLVYLVWLIRDLHRLRLERGWSKALRPIWALLVGGCAFGIPYLALFVIPRWREIIAMVRSADATTGGMPAAIIEHIRSYHSYYTLFPAGQFTKVLYFPFAIGIPTVLISTAILLPIRQIRGLVLAGLPYLLFLLLFVSRKRTDYWYFLPELMIYVCSLAILFAIICRTTVGRFWPRFRYVFVPLLTVVLGSGLILGMREMGVRTISLQVRPNAMAIARAAGREMLGPNALVGARVGRFYANGADVSYWLEPDMWSGRVSDTDLRKYLGKFDAIAEDPHMSNSGFNESNETLSWWYSDQVLSLRGFFLSGLGPDYLLLSATPPDRLRGYGLHRDGRVVRFSEQKSADWILVAVVCGRDQWNKLALNTLFERAYLLPKRETVEQQLDVLVMSNKDYQSRRSTIGSQCIIRDEIPVMMEEIDADQLLATLQNDRTIRFYETLDQAVEARRSKFEGTGPPSTGYTIH